MTAGAEPVGPRGLEDLLRPAPWRVWLVSECGPEWPRGLEDLIGRGIARLARGLEDLLLLRGQSTCQMRLLIRSIEDSLATGVAL